MNLIEIYIHIPFCVRKCAYCDFLSAPADESVREKYVQMLCREIEVCGKELEDYEVSTVFFGGGTPSILTGEQIQRMMNTLRSVFRISAEAEITLEMNPGTADEKKLEMYKKAGVNRLSIGLQSVHDEELKMLGRIHTYEEFLKSYRMARETGFDNINVDLISAIPGQTVDSWEETLHTVLALKPEHISAYSLIIEPGTPFYDLYGEEDEKGETPAGKRAHGYSEKQERQELPSEDEERMIYRRTKEILQEAGYERYEISNYARPGYECRHNLGYWERIPYLGFGVGAASLFEHARYTNPSEFDEYRECFLEKMSGDLLSREEEMEEFMFLGLRKMKGISKDEFRQCFGEETGNVYGRQIEKLKTLNLIRETEERILLTDKGIDVSNAVFVEFML